MCPDAYRAALTQDFRIRARPQKNDPGRRGGAPAGTAAGGRPPVTLAKDAAVVNGEAADQR
jgi:hypothetical protein